MVVDTLVTRHIFDGSVRQTDRPCQGLAEEALERTCFDLGRHSLGEFDHESERATGPQEAYAAVAEANSAPMDVEKDLFSSAGGIGY